MSAAQWEALRRKALGHLTTAQRFAVERAKAERVLARLYVAKRPNRPYVEDRFDPNQERDEYGRWTDTGAGDRPGEPGEGNRRPETESAPAPFATANARGLSNSYGSRSASDVERSRDVAQLVWAPDADGVKLAEKLGVTPQTFNELNSIKGANRFHDAILAAKSASKYGASVHAYGAEDYQDMRLFLTPDGKSGFALKGDDIVSAFKHPDTAGDGYVNSALALATRLGGRRLDAFDTVLPRMYSESGFRAVARLAWNEQYKPEGWDHATYKAFNGGRPDIIFMVFDPDFRDYEKGDGVRVTDYDAGNAKQRETLKVIEEREKPLLSPSSSMTHAEIAARVDKVAKDLEFDPRRITITDSEHPFELNGQRLQAAGTASTYRVGLIEHDPQKPASTALVTLYAKHIKSDFVDGVIAHEIEHIKYENALVRYKAEFDQIMREPPGVDLMRGDGRLKPPYDEKYPIYTAMHAALYQHGTKDFAASDGVTNYSVEWWKNWKDRGLTAADSKSALHETLAEMAKIKYNTGKFPTPDDYYGHRSVAWRTPPGGDPYDTPKPSKTQMEANAKLWRDLYRAVDKVWKLKPV